MHLHRNPLVLLAHNQHRNLRNSRLLVPPLNQPAPLLLNPLASLLAIQRHSQPPRLRHSPVVNLASNPPDNQPVNPLAGPQPNHLCNLHLNLAASQVPSLLRSQPIQLLNQPLNRRVNLHLPQLLSQRHSHLADQQPSRLVFQPDSQVAIPQVNLHRSQRVDLLQTPLLSQVDSLQYNHQVSPLVNPPLSLLADLALSLPASPHVALPLNLPVNLHLSHRHNQLCSHQRSRPHSRQAVLHRNHHQALLDNHLVNHQADQLLNLVGSLVGDLLLNLQAGRPVNPHHSRQCSHLANLLANHPDGLRGSLPRNLHLNPQAFPVDSQRCAQQQVVQLLGLPLLLQSIQRHPVQQPMEKQIPQLDILPQHLPLMSEIINKPQFINSLCLIIALCRRLRVVSPFRHSFIRV